MTANIEISLLDRLLPSSGVCVHVGPAGTECADWLRHFRPQMVVRSIRPEDPGNSIDHLSTVAAFRRIHLLNVEADCGVLSSLRGATALLDKSRIDVIRFVNGPGLQAAGESLYDIGSFLLPWGFFLVKILPQGPVRVHSVAPGQHHAPGIFLALSLRFETLLTPAASGPSIVDLAKLTADYRLTPRGIVHVGAHDGQELDLYKKMGFKRILFVEANPELTHRLAARTAQDPTVKVAHCAASDVDGTTTLRITSMDQSSSILPLKLHKKYYPTVHETRQVIVPARRLDTLLSEWGVNASEFNYVHLDIQGAELLALRGALGLLEHIEALTTEVNFEELYDGCALAEDIDDLLRPRGFALKTVACPHHSSWGDAFYLRTPPNAPKKAGILTMSTLGTNGRFGNQMFQYMFLRLLAQQHGMQVQTSPWAGQSLFGHADAPITQNFPDLREGREIADAIFPRTLLGQWPGNRELWGYFQFDTVHYAPHREFIRSLFRPVPAISSKFHEATRRLGLSGRSLVCLHLRRGDYVGCQFGVFFAAPTSWYRPLLEQIWPALRDPVLYIASDEPEKVVGDFAEYHPITSKDLGVEIPEAPLYSDFFMLSQADVLAISNSSFSFLSAMLNEKARLFYRPNRYIGKLVPFDPWNASPLLHRELGPPASAVVQPPSHALLADPGAVTVLERRSNGAMVVTFGTRGQS